MGRGRSTPSEIHTNKTVKDCLFYLVSSNKASDYEITADIFVNTIRNLFNSGNNVSEAFRTMVKSDIDVWKPTLNISSNTDENIKEREDKNFVM